MKVEEKCRGQEGLAEGQGGYLLLSGEKNMEGKRYFGVKADISVDRTNGHDS